ncbi:MAG: ImmA/IrrE family metallo-endopeptidase [Bacteroidaceae bacterium]|nr:ImmA/IrrE family metallo-endopeptidase [Bacteroidaceae bacterium]
MYIHFKELEQGLREYVANASAFDAWAWAIVERIKPAMDKWGKEYGSGGRALWDVVRVVSWRRGVIVKNLSRKKFSELVCTVCPELGVAKALNASLKNSEVSKKHIQNYDQLSETVWLKKYGTRVESLFEEAENEVGNATICQKTHEDYLGDILLARLGEGNTLNCLRRRQIYTVAGVSEQSVQPAWSIETYLNAADREQGRFSQVMAFEWVDEHVTEETLAMLFLRYSRFLCKLVVVSIHGFSTGSIAAATNNHIGLSRMNPDAPFEEALEVVVRRTINNRETENRLKEALTGGCMSGRMIVCDGGKLTTLADMMHYCGIAVNQRYVWTVPYYQKEQIEVMAEDVRSHIPNSHINELALTLARKFGTTSQGYVTADVNEMARRMGLKIMMSDMPSDQYACLDLAGKRIVLNLKIATMTVNHHGTVNHIIRFSIAHELGHFFLHAQALCEHIESFTETDASLSATPQGDNKVKRMEWQANYFAACLLMPKEEVRRLFCQLLKPDERQLLETNKVIYEEQLGRERLYAILLRMSGRMEVSMQAMRIRLSELSLVPQLSAECA